MKTRQEIKNETIEKWQSKIIYDKKHKEIFSFDTKRDWIVLYEEPNRFLDFQKLVESTNEVYVKYAKHDYLVSRVVEMPGGYKMLEIFDEPPTKHTDLVNFKNVKFSKMKVNCNNCQGGGCPVCSSKGFWYEY